MPDYTLTVTFTTSEECQPYLLAHVLRQIADNAAAGQWSGGREKMVGGHSCAWEVTQDRPLPTRTETATMAGICANCGETEEVGE